MCVFGLVGVGVGVGYTRNSVGLFRYLFGSGHEPRLVVFLMRNDEKVSLHS